MNSSAEEWLKHAKDDKDAAENLIHLDYLSNIVAWHCQQCVEKSFKAMMEHFKMDIIHTHDLLKLHRLIENKLNFKIEEPSLIEMNEIYSETRYPSLAGNMPYGKPSTEEARDFLSFAEYIYDNISSQVRN